MFNVQWRLYLLSGGLSITCDLEESVSSEYDMKAQSFAIFFITHGNIFGNFKKCFYPSSCPCLKDAGKMVPFCHQTPFIREWVSF